MKKDSVDLNILPDRAIPEIRKKLLTKLEMFVKQERLIEVNPSTAGINALTKLEKQNPAAPLFFGIGGGSWRELSKGLPFDVLSMVLVGQKIKQILGLGQCYILLANSTTRINGFSKKAVDKVMIGQKDLLQIVLDGLGIKNDWEVFLETNLEEVIGPEAKARYESIVAIADKMPLIGNHYYSRETAITLIFGGIKIGWHAKGVKNDERVFDQKTALYAKHNETPHTTSYIYTPAGIRICPKIVERAPPYVLLWPKKRLCLNYLEDPVAKIRANGGLWSKASRKLFGGTAQLFEEIILGKEIPISGERSFKGQGIAEKTDFILQHIFDGRETEVERIWKKRFSAAL